MRALLVAFILALATAVPVFADDDGAGNRPPVVSTVDFGAYGVAP